MSWWSEFVSFLAGTIVMWGGLLTFARGIIEKKVQQKFDKEIEDHKAKLEAIRDASAFNYQRRIHDFELYSSNRHRIYNEVYQSMFKARSAVFLLRGVIETSDFAKFTSAQLDDFMNKHNFTTTDRTQVNDYFDSQDRQRAIDILKKYEEEERVRKAGNQLADFNNQYYLNELFMSDKVSKLMGQVLKEIENLYNNYRWKVGYEVNSQLREKIEGLEKDCKQAIKEELQSGLLDIKCLTETQ